MSLNASQQLKDIPVFVTAVEAGSFAEAAERLHLTRSAVGKTIARLEDRLGVRLFHRTTRSQQLTADGSLFYERCLRALEEIRMATDMLESGKQQVSGRLRVAVSVLFGRMCVAPVLTQLVTQHPELTLEFSFSDRLVDLVEDGFDLAIRNGTLADRADLIARPVATHYMHLYAAPHWLARYGAPQSLDDLADLPGLIYKYSNGPKAWQFAQPDGRIREILPPHRILMDDLQALADAAIAGHGIAHLPSWLARHALRDGQLVRVLQHHEGISHVAHAVWRKTPHLPPKIRAAVDLLVDQLEVRVNPR
ncbi:LysR family transcriptional regulator [Amantichitinum ursilacus]|uniref:HTH-type transcriptional regulator DmlR n=1 Tax=Amantichitinum ursilacus TaxID=857265 RepID=A0A0N0GP06_9NEIS|nr:LysR family transcriptional regulator [Amantichitinum ursilacus]KPC53246.1 HTH-type transcriptional regulator DmlR [Amantichitinum ursilacus]